MKKLLSSLNNIDISILKVMKNGFKVSFIILLFATYILYLYYINPISHIVFDIGYSIAQCAIMSFVCFLSGALISDKIKKTY